MHRKFVSTLLVSGLVGVLACNRSKSSSPPSDSASHAQHASSAGATSARDGGASGSADAGSSTPETAGSDAGSVTAGSGGAGKGAETTRQTIARGRYVVEHVAACGDCHTARNPDGSFDESRSLAGVDCIVDADPMNPDFGCLSAGNLTNHETGLKNRTDQEIKDMFLKGERPADAGSKPDALHPLMPYWVLGNMSAEDADAIVAYLRTVPAVVPAVEHRVTPRQAPFQLDTPAPRFPEALIPLPVDGYADRAAAMRGRYLAGNVGICMECHTPHDEMDAPSPSLAFQGGREFAVYGMPMPVNSAASVYSANITPDATGIAGWSVQDVVHALKRGESKDQTGAALCPPAPSGLMAAYAGLTDEDAEDIAHYLLSLPPAPLISPQACVAVTTGADAGTR